VRDRGAPRLRLAGIHEAPWWPEQWVQEDLFQPAQANTAIEFGLRTGFDSGAVFLGDRFETRHQQPHAVEDARNPFINDDAKP
jgi:hypothetical protein